MGTPDTMYDSTGKEVWSCELNSYGAVRKNYGKKNDCPFRYQGQYEDSDTGLSYNRFRYYDSRIGNYISQDPIGLEDGNPTLYGYVSDTNIWVDTLGLKHDDGTRQVKDTDASADIDNFLNNKTTTDIQPRKGTVDNDKIFAQQPDGSWQAERMGDHETKKPIGAGSHYHLERFDKNGNFISDEQVFVSKSKRKKCPKK